MPQQRTYNCSTKLQEGRQPPFRLIYNSIQIMLDALCRYIDENLAKNFKEHFRSPAGAPILFLQKKKKIYVCVLTIEAQVKL